MSFAIGNTVGPYRIVEQIGQGGMATVFKAYHANLDRFVAFKVLHPAFKEDPSFLERFKREAQIVARLEHPSIVPVYDYADVAGQPYLVMRFIEGETLKARLKRQPLSLGETIEMLDVVADALSYAHQQGILHRDIKPSNIMLDKTGTPYIADFGLARIAQAGESTLSQDMMLGTPQYISPEQAKGLHDLGPGTDIYSLGVVLYEVVVGRVPFSADTPYAIIHDHIYKPLPLPTQVNPAVPVEVERVLLKALSKEPQDRYATATEMVEAVKQAVQGFELTEITSVSYRPQSVSPSAATAADTAPDAVSPRPTPAYPAVPSPVAQPTGSSASRRARRRRANLWILGGIGALLLTCLTGLFVLVAAVSDPELQPWNTRDTVDAEEPAETVEPDTALLPADMSLGEAQSMIEAHPDDPGAHMILALAQSQDGDLRSAFTNIVRAVDQLDASPELIAETAQRAADSANFGFAIMLYLEVLGCEDLSPELRNEAGEALYRYIQEYPNAVALVTNEMQEYRPKTAMAYTMFALAKLQTNTILSRRQALNSIENALSLDDSLAETYLVRGLYYLTTNQIDRARADWQQALNFPDAPDWVLREVNRLLQEV
ncbi:MAG: protein kinase [Anaerolineae bacterium]|nr:protein kinase [Anaerolineae bacterium]